jgi:single-strand DNA-binding protein
MALDTVTTIVGNLSDDPNVCDLPTGGQVANLTIIANPRFFDQSTGQWKDGDPIPVRCNAWGAYVKNVAASLHKGTRVIATGRLKMNRFTDAKGIERDNLEMDIDAIGPDLRFATAKVEKRTRS